MLVVALAGALAQGCGADGAESRACDFPAADWQRVARMHSDDAAGRERKRLARTILDCELLEGKSRAAVHELLGPPTEDYGNVRWYYIDNLVDDEYLAVRYDRSGRVTETEYVIQ